MTATPMTLPNFALVLACVLLGAGAQLLLKAGARVLGAIEMSGSGLFGSIWPAATQPYILAGLGCYGISVGLWVVALSRVDVSVAYPMTSIGYIVTSLVAWWFFGEVLTPARMAGLVLILAGVYLLTRG